MGTRCMRSASAVDGAVTAWKFRESPPPGGRCLVVRGVSNISDPKFVADSRRAVGHPKCHRAGAVGSPILRVEEIPRIHYPLNFKTKATACQQGRNTHVIVPEADN